MIQRIISFKTWKSTACLISCPESTEISHVPQPAKLQFDQGYGSSVCMYKAVQCAQDRWKRLAAPATCLFRMSVGGAEETMQSTQESVYTGLFAFLVY